MKKILIALLSFALIFAFCSCGLFDKDETEKNEGENNVGTVIPPEPETLKFEKTPDGRYYTVVGIGTFTGENIVIPKLYKSRAVKSVSDGAFSGNTHIKTLTVEDGVEKIGANAFSDCTSLESVRISKSLEKIGTSAFENCASLKTLIFGRGTEEIGQNAFLNCSSINEFFYEGSLSDFINITGSTWCELEFETQYLYTNDYPTAAGHFWHWGEDGNPLIWEEYIGNEGLRFEISEDGTYYKVVSNSNTADKYVVIPKAHRGLPVGEIDAMAFVSASVQEIVIPETVTRISGAAFRWCANLKSITLPDSVEFIGESAFSGCDALKSVTLSKGLKEIGDSAFVGCTAISEIVIPDSVKKIGNEAFYGCSGLTYVKFGNGVEEIGERAFYLCIELTDIEIPKLVKVLKTGAFADCLSLNSVILHSDVTDIERKALPASAKVYYEADGEAFAKINVGEDNLWLSNLYLYSATEPENEGKLWYRGDNGEIVIW
ncbi:MAG: leucine-rich repeat domain-containing protein [Ruminococcaceae bacterium]|nr:leucine-rich repeat domain-containing protein [Oscillospiraceae bacterium]